MCSDKHALTHAGVQYCQQFFYEAVTSKVKLSASIVPVSMSFCLTKGCAANSPYRYQSTGSDVLWRLHGMYQACVSAHTHEDLVVPVADL